ncbi:glycosyltransferase [Streptomyces sp. NPDC051940]|uniref:glycosyltransferase n=1 Tax=Streptomyces sp. NPDC051940 TaxID=3155675 RepID=UPI003416D030
MSIKVSVVVPVYNPGRYIEDCVASLLRQSLPDDEYEAVFVDDGSTDDTPELLDRLAAEHPNMHVIHQEPSGWSGRPRNVGTDAARGEFVMYVDNDDWLGDEALERMYRYGVENGADIVIGKMAGKGRPVPRELFRVNRPHATVADAPLIDSLTPHKMFRRDFLERTGLRFPEGRRRLEDHVFVAEAYLLAGNVSVLSDYVCYHHVKREDEGNAGFRQIEPVGYFKNLRDALDAVERHTEPGELRDRLFRRWLRVEMVERLRGNRLLKVAEQDRAPLFAEIQTLVNERFGPEVAAPLPFAQRAVAALATAGRLADVEEFARWEAGIKAAGRLTDLRWDQERLRLAFTGELTTDEKPMAFRTEDGQAQLDLPLGEEAAAVVAAQSVDLRAPVDGAAVDLVLRERATSAEFFQPVEVTREQLPLADGSFRLVLHADGTIDPATAANGGPLGRGVWDVVIRVRSCGWAKDVRLGSVRDDAAERGRVAALTGSPVRLVLPYWTEPFGNLSLDVDQSMRLFRKELEPLHPRDARIRGRALRLPLPLLAGAGATAVVKLREAGGRRTIPIRAALEPEGDGCVLVAPLATRAVAGNAWHLDLALPQSARPKPVAYTLPLGVRGSLVGVRITAPPAGPSRLRPLIVRARRALRPVKRAWLKFRAARSG